MTDLNDKLLDEWEKEYNLFITRYPLYIDLECNRILALISALRESREKLAIVEDSLRVAEEALQLIKDNTVQIADVYGKKHYDQICDALNKIKGQEPDGQNHG